MGLFRRKDSRAQNNSEHPLQQHNKPTFDPHGRQYSNDKLSDYSLKSPSLTTTSSSFRSTMVISIPEIEIQPAPDPTKHPAKYLRSIYAVRERSRIVLDKAKQNQLSHFDVDLTKFQDTADYVVSIIKVGLSVHCLQTSAGLHVISATLLLTTARFHLMVGGSISRWVGDHE